MAHNPREIRLVSFGQYSKDSGNQRKKYLPSIPQLPLNNGYGGFDYLLYMTQLDGASKVKSRIVISPDDLEYIGTVVEVFDHFPATIRCEGKHHECKERAIHLVLPYGIEANRDEKVIKGGPKWINQTYPLNSLFLCSDCAAEESFIHCGRALKMDISFRLPSFLTTFPHKLEWNVDQAELYGRNLRKAACQLSKHAISEEIEMRRVRKEKVVVNRFVAQRILSRTLGVPENQLPEINTEYRTRNISWRIDNQPLLFPDFHDSHKPLKHL